MSQVAWVSALLLAIFASSPFTQCQIWTQQFPSTSPQSRYYPAMAYDAAHKQIVLFGGMDTNGGYLNDTWIWDGTNWVALFPSNSPPARSSHAMAYDEARGQVVLFGGLLNGFVAAGDTWAWDGATWTQLFPSTAPPKRYSIAMAYDTAHTQIVLFAGQLAVGVTANDTWVWDGTNWTQRFPAASPPTRSANALAYDWTNNNVLLFGGNSSKCGASGDCGDTWLWNGTDWVQQFPATSPSHRFDSVMASDVGNKQVVLFGGVDSGNALGDTWVWDGVNWALESVVPSPPPSDIAAMATGANNHIVLFDWNQTWMWTGATIQFLQFPLHGFTPSTAGISSVMDHNIAVDPKGTLIFYKPLNGLVDAYTGDEGTANCGLPNCVKNSQGVIGYKNTAGSNFKDGLPNYTGDYWLFYDGHPGYDYPAVLGTDIYAPASGIAFIPDCDPVTRSADCSGTPAGAAVDGFNILTIDHQNGYSTWYLHMGDMVQVKKEPHVIPAQSPYQIVVVHSGAGVFQTPQSVVYTATGLSLKKVKANPIVGQYAVDQTGLYSFSAADAAIAVSITYLYQGADFRVVTCPNTAPVILHRGDGQKVPVTTDCKVGKTGNKALNAILRPHLHFEVRKGLIQTNGSYQCLPPKCVPIDPYGWTSPSKPDPYPAGPNVPLWK
jgi:hypothetical protein